LIQGGKKIMKKKFLSIAMIAALTASMLVGCGSSSSSEDSASDTTETDDTTADDAQADEAGDDAAVTTVTDGVLTMATNAYFPPYEYYEGDDIVGIDAEIAQAIADKLGLTLQIEDMEFDSIITAVQSGKADLGLAGMTVTDERKQSVNFSDSYATGIQSIVVAEDSDIATVDDLEGKMIGVQLSTTGDLYASDDYGTDHVEEYNKGADAIMALKQGKVDAVIIDNEPAKSFVASNDGLKILDTEYTVEDYAACINKDNTGLLDAVNGALAELKEDGTLQSILDKYITAE
jgi:polar amino acid transport system substrate-binding protein